MIFKDANLKYALLSHTFMILTLTFPLYCSVCTNEEIQNFLHMVRLSYNVGRM